MNEIVQLEFEDMNRESNKFPIYVLTNGIRLAKNIGSVFRISEAFGVSNIIIQGLNEKLPNKKFSRVARATEQNISYQQVDDLKPEIQLLKEQGYTIVGLEITNNSIPLDKVNFKDHPKLAIILGAEVEGIDQELLTLTDMNLHIDMYGVNLSMNVTHALGIMLYEITKQIKN